EMGADLAAQTETLVTYLRRALQAAAFSNRGSLSPRRLPQIAEAEAESFLNFLSTLEADEVRAWGSELAQMGLSEMSVLEMNAALSQFLLDHVEVGSLPLLIRSANLYLSAFLEGFVEALKIAILDEQENIRHALQQLMEKRNLQLGTAIEVSRSITTTLDLEKLLLQVVNLVQESFGYYHVHIYTLAEDDGYLLMREGTGEPGRIMKERGHKIEIGKGLVGRVGECGEAVLVTDVSQSSQWMPNPLLPETKSELTVPLKIGERVVGVLDLQSDKLNGLSEEDLSLMIGLGDQIAVAIENARLFEEAQRTLADLQKAYKRQERLSATIRALSTPVIQVWDKVLVLPLVGAIDSERATRIMEDLLEGIVKHQADVVIIDVTGVPVVDTQVAHHLLQAIRAAGLLGTRCLLTGISSDVAKTMVDLGVGLSSVTTLSNLQAGIQRALADMGVKIARAEGR
ncbi:MAG: GAF domain-containing protein, partial [Chloroflexota bacterium]|nr:GAF domain-containing protein [Chloroflexota bacterium]